MKKVNPKTEKFLRGFGQLAGLITGRSAYKDFTQEDYGSKEDVIKYLEGPY